MPLSPRSRAVLPGHVHCPPVESVHTQQREKGGEFVAVLAEPREVLGFQEQAQNLGRTEGGGKDMMGLGLLGKDPQPPLASGGAARRPPVQRG